MRFRWFGALALAVIILILGVRAYSPVPTPESEGNNGENSGNQSSATNQGEGRSVEIVDSGFGQDGNSVQGMVIVTNTGEGSVGEFVTATVNYLDAEGEIISTEEQVEAFTWVGQELALPVSFFAEQPGVTVASMKPYVSLSDYGMGETAREPLPVLQATDITPAGTAGIQRLSISPMRQVKTWRTSG